MVFYGVRQGRRTGVYQTWAECEAQIRGFSGASFKKFATVTEARYYVTAEGQSAASSKGYTWNDTSPVFGSYSHCSSKPGHSPAGNGRGDATYFGTFTSQEPSPAIPEDIYVDGSCLNNGRRNAVAGYGVYFGDNDSRNISKPLYDDPTNNRAELMACLEAIKAGDQQRPIVLHTDSQYCQNIFTTWVHSWKKNGWKRPGGQPVENVDIVSEIDRHISMRRQPVSFVYVPGHSGDHGNDRAHDLAMSASQSQL